MRIATIDVKGGSSYDPIYISLVGDTHIGARDVDKPAIKKHARWIRDHNAICLLMGDLCEHISLHDKRFDPTTLDKDLKLEDLDRLCQAEVDEFLRIFDLALPNVAFIIKGNHEHTPKKSGVYNPHTDLINRLKAYNATHTDVALNSKTGVSITNILDGGMSCLLRIKHTRDKERHIISAYIHHGWFYGTRGNISNKLEATIHKYDVDLALVGHGHKAVCVGPIERPRPNQVWEKIEIKRSWGVMTAPWKSGDDNQAITYEETRGISPSFTGPTVLKWTPVTGDIQVLFGEDALNSLKKAI